MPQPSAIAVVAHSGEVPGCDGLLERGALCVLAAQTNGVRAPR